jgi:membrane protein DedA with SNARE-associated domain
MAVGGLAADHLEAVMPYLAQYGAWAVFAGVLLEDFGVPMPGEALLIAGSVLAARHDLNIAWLLALAWAAAVVGDNIGYLIGVTGGRALVLRFGRYLFLDRQRLARVESFFARHGGQVVVGARFVEGLRQLNGVVAGISRMPWRTFLPYNALGALVWVGVWGGGAYLLGQRLDVVLAHFHRVQQSFWVGALVGAGVLLAGYVVWKMAGGSSE